MNHRRLFAAALTCVALNVGLAPALAWADAPQGAKLEAGVPRVTPTEVMVLHATQGDSPSIDPAIGHLPQLTKPPFSSYNRYKLLDRKTLSVPTGKAALHPLPNGRTLQITTEPAGKAYRVTVAISQPSGSSYLKLLEITAPPNEPFFVAGQSYQGGSLVLAITIKN